MTGCARHPGRYLDMCHDCRQASIADYEARGLCTDWATTRSEGGSRFDLARLCGNPVKWLLIQHEGSLETGKQKVCGVHKRTAIGRYYPTGLTIEPLAQPSEQNKETAK